MNELLKLLEEDAILAPSTNCYWYREDLYSLIKHLLPFHNKYIEIKDPSKNLLIIIELTDIGKMKQKILQSIMNKENRYIQINIISAKIRDILEEIKTCQP